MQTMNVLKNKNEQYQAVGDQKWTKQEIEDCVTFVRLELYSRDMPCGPKAVQERLRTFYHAKPLPSERTIARILVRHGLTHSRQVFTHDKKEYCPFYVGASPHTPGVYRFLEYRMGRKRKDRTICPAHPYIHLPRRSGRSPALPCPLDRSDQFIVWALKSNNNFVNSKLGMREDRKMNLSSRSLGTSKIIVA